MFQTLWDFLVNNCFWDIRAWWFFWRIIAGLIILYWMTYALIFYKHWGYIFILFPKKRVLLQQMQLYAWGTFLSFLFQILLWKKMGVLFYFPPNSSKTCAHVQCILVMSFVRDRSKGEWISQPEMDHHWTKVSLAFMSVIQFQFKDHWIR